jgi:putative tricarboxylic transport membrane protein
VTSWDGYPLTKQGRASEALDAALKASVIGGLISGLLLLLFAPQVAKWALRFGPPEMFSLTFLGLAVIARVSGNTPIKGLVAAAFGLLFAAVGIDTISGIARFTFGMSSLYGGFDIIPVCIGLFAIAEIFIQIEKRAKYIVPEEIKSAGKYSWKQMIPKTFLLIKASLIGGVVGAIPGTGGSVASFIAYDDAKRSSKNPELFGKGSLEGILVAEAANNGVTGGTLIPTFTLGIPGSSAAAIYLGALMIHGLTPGPQLFQFEGQLMYTIFFAFFFINVIMYFMGSVAAKWALKVLAIPSSILYPVVLAFCLIGGYAVNGTMIGVNVSLFFGVIGYLMLKNGYPTAPMVIAIILGPKVEEALRQSLVLSDNDPSIFFTRPISLTFIIIILLTSIIPVIKRRIKWFKS